MPHPCSAARLALACLLALPLAAPAMAEDVVLRSSPLTLDGKDPARTTVGKLEWRGGIAIASDSRRFGGWSGMLIEDGGKRLLAVSDVAHWLRAELRYDAKGMLVGIDGGALDLMQDENGAPFAGGRGIDAESLTRMADGTLLVGFERLHRVLAWPGGNELSGGGLAGRPIRIPQPPGLEASPDNEGLEALATLADGRVLAISENLAAGDGLVRAWIGSGSGASMAWQALSYRTVPPFQPTGAAVLPNGDVIVTERTFNPIEGVRVRVVRLRRDSIAPGAIVEPQELARLIAPVITENLESVDAALLPDGRVGLWILSDDNFNPAQRTILLHFALVD